MLNVELPPNQVPIVDILKWQRDGQLDLQPDFQRRSVWKPGAKSYLVDTIIQGFPVPLVFLRSRIDSDSFSMLREVVDGQQRLRTVLSFVDETSLQDFDPHRDRFTISRTHSREYGGSRFKDLPPSVRDRILQYKFSIITLPPSIEDRDVLQLFARLNSTGLKLQQQELRNAEFFGTFKTLMYSLSYEQLERWQRWNLFSGTDLSRMKEVEFTSDLAVNYLWGVSGKSQAKITSAYKEYDAEFLLGDSFAETFRVVMNAIDDAFGSRLAGTIYDREMHFWTLWMAAYTYLYGPAGQQPKQRVRALPSGLFEKLLALDRRFATNDLPQAVEAASSGAATDKGRRETRYKFFMEQLGL